MLYEVALTIKPVGGNRFLHLPVCSLGGEAKVKSAYQPSVPHGQCLALVSVYNQAAKEYQSAPQKWDGRERHCESKVSFPRKYRKHSCISCTPNFQT